jgi:hypothetical protein
LQTVAENVKQLREEHELISIAIALLEALINQRSTPAKRGRGGPPGSKNKPRLRELGEGAKRR